MNRYVNVSSSILTRLRVRIPTACLRMEKGVFSHLNMEKRHSRVRGQRWALPSGVPRQVLSVPAVTLWFGCVCACAGVLSFWCSCWNWGKHQTCLDSLTKASQPSERADIALGETSLTLRRLPASPPPQFSISHSSPSQHREPFCINSPYLSLFPLLLPYS